MKVLILSLNYAPEQIGIGPCSTGWAEHLARAGHRVTVVTAQPYYPDWRIAAGHRNLWRRTMENGVKVVRCPHYVPRQPTGVRRVLHQASFALAAMWPMLARAIVRRPDLVVAVAPSLIAAPVARFATVLAGAKSWLHVQDFELEAALSTGLLAEGFLLNAASRFERTMLSSFDVISTISPQMCRKLAAKGVPEGQIRELRNWADIDAIEPLDRPSPLRREWQISAPHVALYSGNIANKQGIDLVLDAARILRQRSDIQFVICGNGPDRARLESLAADLPNVCFHDLQPRERLADVLGLASVHLLPQIAGIADLVLPSKLANMFASGRPVVATAAPGTGIADEVRGAGVVVPPGDAATFAAAIANLLNDPDRRARLGRAARIKAERSWARSAILQRCDQEMRQLAFK